MLIKLLLLLAFGLKQASAICFHNETSNVKRNVTGRPKAVDDYHCKIMCVENTDCLAYIFPENECFLLGNLAHDAYTTCIKQYYEWVKKIDDGNCTEDKVAPKIYDEYVPNPALALAAPIENLDVDKFTPYPSGAYILDIMLPDNSHQVHANYRRMISWDGKLGSWILTKLNRTAGVDSNITTYIRAVKGFTYDPTDFSDPTSCGMNIPDMDIPVAKQTNYESTGAAQPYKQLTTDLCPDRFMYLHETSDVPIDTTGSALFVSCIDGEWFIHSQFMTSRKVVNGTCVKYK